MRITIMTSECIRCIRNVISYDLDYKFGSNKFIFIKHQSGVLLMKCDGIDVVEIHNEDKKNG